MLRVVMWQHAATSLLLALKKSNCGQNNSDFSEDIVTPWRWS